MLTKVFIQNFKPFGEPEQTIELGKVTIFIGPNGTGKSSVLQGLQLLAQSTGANSLQSGRFQYSEYSELAHKTIASKSMSLGFAGRAPHPLRDKSYVEFSCRATFASPGNLIEQTGALREEVLTGGLTEYFQARYHYGDTEVRPTKIERPGYSVNVEAGSNICSPLHAGGGSHQGKDYEKPFRQLLQEVLSLFNVFPAGMKRVFVVGALRGFDQLLYPLGESDFERPDTGSQIIDTFAYRRETEAKISQWLEEVTGVRVSFHLLPKRMGRLESADGYNIYHEGFGTNQLIKPLLQIAIAPSDSLVAIEEAEIHLHPQAQVKLCDLLARVSSEEDKQIVLTTHSEHILTGFLNLIAEGKLSPADLSVYFFEKEKGQARATHLRVDEKGALEGGLRGFANVSLDEFGRHLKALSKRK